jgi:hypothetical protein
VPEDTDVDQSPRLICDECGSKSDDRAWGWEAYLGYEDDGTESVAVFCPECVVEFSPGI